MSWLAAVLIAALVVAVAADASTHVTVEPKVGGTTTTFKVKLLAPTTIKRGSEFRYVARIGLKRGRAGAAHCDTVARKRIGRRVKKGAKLSFKLRPGFPSRNPRWCKGTYKGTIALEDYHPDPCIGDDGICRDGPYTDRRVKARFRLRAR
jgi:hypothetical protein